MNREQASGAQNEFVIFVKALWCKRADPFENSPVEQAEAWHEEVFTVDEQIEDPSVVRAQGGCVQQAPHIIHGIVAAVRNGRFLASLKYGKFRCNFLWKPAIIGIEERNVPAARMTERGIARGSGS